MPYIMHAKSSLFEPEDRAERPREKDALDGRKRDEALGQARVRVHPLDGPLGLVAHSRHRLDRGEQLLALVGVLDVRIDEQGVHFRVDVLHHILKLVKPLGLWDLHLGHKVRRQVLVHDPVGCSKKGEHVLYEILLVGAQRLPVLDIMRKVDFLGSPEARLVLLVHVPDLWVPDGKQRPPPAVRAQHRVLRHANLVSGTRFRAAYMQVPIPK
jgi:hypothetical protein